MDNKIHNALNGFGGEMGKQIGQLYMLSVIQTSAMLDLATALKNEKNLSTETREAADQALETIDRLIVKLDEAMAEIYVKGIRKNMRKDFRILYGALVAVALGLAALMAKGFGWM